MTDSDPPEQTRKPTAPAKQESLLANLLINIIIPALILAKLSGDDWLGTKWAIVVALAFPLLYGLRDFLKTGRANFFSGLGIISILLTGGISLMELDAKYIAIKEAAIPALLGFATIVSLRTRWPLVKTFLYNDKVLDTEKIASRLAENNSVSAFEQTLKQASWMVAASFFLSSVLNYFLAMLILTSPPGTEAFNAELGKMTALSYPVIVLPSMIVLILAMVFLFRRIGKLTGLKLEEIMAAHHR